MKNEKILITGVTSPFAIPLAKSLAKDNEVWGAARFSDAAARADLESAGVKTAVIDFGAGDMSAVPDDFTYVVHLAYFRSPEPDFEEAYRVNGDGVGFVLSHCRKAKAALYMSSHVIYSVNDDPWHAKVETDHIGAAKPGYSQTSMVSKIAGEAVAHFCSREFNLPVTIARLNAPYGNFPSMPIFSMDAIMAGKPVGARWEPEPYSPIHIDDVIEQLPAMLNAASVPANIVNWAGDEVVTVQEWSGWIGEWAGVKAEVAVKPPPFSAKGSAANVSKRKAITGPCKRTLKEGLREVFEARHGKAKA